VRDIRQKGAMSVSK